MGRKVKKLPTIEKILVNHCINLVKKHGVCPDSDMKEMINAIVYSHDRGYLYTNRKANTFVCGYRIPEVNDKWRVTIPEEETGEIFFVNFAVSEDSSKWALLKMLRSYLRDNPDIHDLVYYRRNSDTDFRQIHIRRSDNVE